MAKSAQTTTTKILVLVPFRDRLQPKIKGTNYHPIIDAGTILDYTCDADRLQMLIDKKYVKVVEEAKKEAKS